MWDPPCYMWIFWEFPAQEFKISGEEQFNEFECDFMWCVKGNLQLNAPLFVTKSL